jgi:hypothetical protein
MIADRDDGERIGETCMKKMNADKSKKIENYEVMAEAWGNAVSSALGIEEIL